MAPSAGGAGGGAQGRSVVYGGAPPCSGRPTDVCVTPTTFDVAVNTEITINRREGRRCDGGLTIRCKLRRKPTVAQLIAKHLAADSTVAVGISDRSEE